MTDLSSPKPDVSKPNRLAEFWQSDLVYAFRHAPVAIVSLGIVLLLVFSAILAPWIAPHNPFDPATLNLLNGFTRPNTPNEFTQDMFWLGTDDQGRDVFSTILYGMRISLFVGFSAVLLAMIIGITLGLIAGYVGGWIETIIMRIADVQLTFPSILVAMLIFGVAKGFTPIEYRNQMAIWVLIIAIGLSDWVQFARVVRGATLVEKNREYVQAARLIGRSPVAIMVKHILPNILSPVLVIATISLALAIIAEATLSFLGVGAPPTQPSLGTLIRIGQKFLFSGQWWIIVFPSVTLLALALSVNLLGDWLRDVLNPRLTVTSALSAMASFCCSSLAALSASFWASTRSLARRRSRLFSCADHSRTPERAVISVPPAQGHPAVNRPASQLPSGRQQAWPKGNGHSSPAQLVPEPFHIPH